MSASLAAPQNPAEAQILKYNADNIGIDGYNFAYETSNGISHQEVGELKKVENEDVVVVRGSYRYIGNDGVTYEVTYIADENGFQPQGAHLVAWIKRFN